MVYNYLRKGELKMCGRFTQRADAKALAKAFEVAEVPAVEARYNIAPTQDILAVRETADGREMTFLKWGLVPSWAKDRSIGAKLINARAETVGEKPAFREAFRKRRCVIPADGFYEWQKTEQGKQPFFFRMIDERPFGFAGLWERWEGEGRVVNSCAILTTEANEVLRPVHDRMPVILHPGDYELWLDEDVRKRELLSDLLRPYPASEMTAYPVSTLVNSARSQGEELVKNVEVNSA
jgi:putative SOS response-associated peptidase YedK